MEESMDNFGMINEAMKPDMFWWVSHSARGLGFILFPDGRR